jgi:hypothetical protein
MLPPQRLRRMQQPVKQLLRQRLMQQRQRHLLQSNYIKSV